MATIFANNPQSALVFAHANRTRSKVGDHAAILAVWLITFSGFLASLEILSRGMIVGLATILLASFLLLRMSEKADLFALFALTAVTLLFPAIYFAHDGQIPQVNYFLGPALGIAAAMADRDLFRKYVYIILILQAFLQIYEWINGSFVFYAIGKYDGALYDEKAFEGAIGIFRSKGLFDASTILGATLIYICAIFNRNVFIICLSIFCCFVGYARLGLLLTTTILFIYVATSGLSAKKIFLLALAGIFMFMSIGLFLNFAQGKAFNMDFLFDALDLGSSQNVDRANFWQDGLAFFSSVGFIEFFLGANERFLTEVGTSVENAWMNILYFAGALMAILYFAAIVRSKSVANMAWNQWAVRLVVISAGMIAATFHSMATCMWFWLTALHLFEQSGDSAAKPRFPGNKIFTY